MTPQRSPMWFEALGGATVAAHAWQSIWDLSLDCRIAINLGPKGQNVQSQMARNTTIYHYIPVLFLKGLNTYIFFLRFVFVIVGGAFVRAAPNKFNDSFSVWALSFLPPMWVPRARVSSRVAQLRLWCGKQCRPSGLCQQLGGGFVRVSFSGPGGQG